MTTSSRAQPAPTSPSRISDYVTVLKPRITVPVVIAAGVGFYMGLPSAGASGVPLTLGMTCVGLALVVGGANGLNQLIERRHDALMPRTADRPLAAGRLAPNGVFWFASACSVVGLVVLGVFVNLPCAVVAAASWSMYVLVYTPLKRVTPWCVPVGAIPGALPPVIGWTASSGGVRAASFALFAIMFVWQLPHFLAIAWLYRDDYEAAGYPVLPVVEPTGRQTVIEMIAYSLVLLPVSLLPTWFKLTGYVYYVGAIVIGLAFLAFSLEVARLRTRISARQHMLASLAYLTVLFGLMSFDKMKL